MPAAASGLQRCKAKSFGQTYFQTYLQVELKMTPKTDILIMGFTRTYIRPDISSGYSAMLKLGFRAAGDSAAGESASAAGRLNMPESDSS